METATELTALKSPANGTDDREARSFCWYAARTQMNCERKAEKEFKNFAAETYLPTQEEIHTWSDRKKKVQRIVIPMILFVKMSRNDAKKVHHTSYFYGFIGNDRHNTAPAPIPDHDIETLKFMLGHSSSSVTFETQRPRLGDRVKVVRGNLSGLEGNILMCKDSQSYVIVALNGIGFAKVQININDLKVINS